jgi:AraC family transcriptional regulator of adaptative response/methylated-DNA-[protein]-cysteine methyltransferase
MTALEVQELCAWIDQNKDASLTLADLSKHTGLSPAHLQRSFKAIVGVSPRQYLESLRVKEFKQSLRDQTDVTTAIYNAGFSSPSRIYEKTDAHLGMTPMDYRGGGAGIEISYAAEETPLGLMMIGATDRGLCFIQFGDSKESLLDLLAEEYPRATRTPMPDPPSPEYQKWMEALNAYLAGQKTDLQLPVQVRATAFQMKVWKYLQTIPAGSVESYQEVAKGIGAPKATRAVARACATNTVAMAIPCHRVIRATGALGGYRWGLERKRVLIANEKRTACA